MINSATGSGGEWEKAVIHLNDGVVKGFLETHKGGTLDEMLRNVTAAPPPVLRIRLLGEEQIREVTIEEIKAIFYVRDFDGDPQHRDLRFYRGAPIVHGVWLRLEFSDGEIMEGLVHNTMRFLVDSGFFVRPTDPDGNNRLVFVMKKWLRECRVLGLRDI